MTNIDINQRTALLIDRALVDAMNRAITVYGPENAETCQKMLDKIDKVRETVTKEAGWTQIPFEYDVPYDDLLHRHVHKGNCDCQTCCQKIRRWKLVV